MTELNGNFQNIGRETFQALSRAAQSQNKIEASEIDAIREAAAADGEVTTGEESLIQQLEKSTQDEHTIRNFQFIDMEPNSLDFDNKDLTIVNNTGVIHDRAKTTDTQLTIAQNAMGETAHIMDMATSMSRNEYNQNIWNPARFYSQSQEQLHTQISTLNTLIEQVSSTTPLQQTTLNNLEQLKDLTQSLLDVHQEISQSNKRSRDGKYENAGSVIEKVNTARLLLAQISPDIIGRENYTLLHSTLQEYNAIAVAFPGHTAGHPDAAGRLDSFFMQVHFRVRQLDEGHRRGENPDVNGALETYINDRKAYAAFARGFAELDQQLENNQFSTEQDYVEAVLALVNSPNENYRSAIEQVAHANWNQQLGQDNMNASEGHLATARQRLESAYGQLAQAEQAIGSSRLNIMLSQTALLQNDLDGAQEVLQAAQELRQRATEHLSSYEELKTQGGSNLEQAEKHRQAALRAIETSESYLELVRSGPYSRHLQQQTDGISSENAGLRQRAAIVDTEISHLEDRVEEMDRLKTGLESGLQTLSTDLSFSELQVATLSHAESGITQAQERISGHFNRYENDLSEEVKAYLIDPASVSIDDMADVREDLQELFEDHPSLATAVAEEMTSLQADFNALRTEMQEQLQQATAHNNGPRIEQLEAQMRSLDMMEHQIVDGWLAQQSTLVEALMLARNESDQVKSAIAGTVGWIESTQERFASNVLLDSDQRTGLAERFTHSLNQAGMEEIADKIERTTRSYGQPIDTVPVVMTMNGTGAMMNFNAYVYENGNSYRVLNPLDKKFYDGSTPEAALANMANHTRLADATMQYHDSQGLHTSNIEPPEDNSTTNGIMTGLAIVGGIILMAIPEPATTAAGAAVVFGTAAVGVSSTYFVINGASQMNDLLENDNFGNNRATWMAALDIGGGLLGVAGAAGSLGRVAQLAKVEHALVQSVSRLAPLGTSRALMGAELADGAIGIGMASEQIVNIYNNPNLSDSEKAQAIAQISLLTATPFLMAGAIARRRSADASTMQGQEIQGNHQHYQRILSTMDEALDGAQIAEVQQASRTSIQQALNDAEAFYRSDALNGHPELRQQGLDQIAQFKQKWTLPDNGTMIHGTSVEHIRSNPQSEISGLNREQMAEVAAETIPGMTKDQAMALLDAAHSRGIEVTVGGSRARSFFNNELDYKPHSDVDMGFHAEGGVSTNKWKAILKAFDKSGDLVSERGIKIITGNETPNVPRIENPAEFFQRQGQRTEPGREGEAYHPTGSITFTPEGTIRFEPPGSGHTPGATSE